MLREQQWQAGLWKPYGCTKLFCCVTQRSKVTANSLSRICFSFSVSLLGYFLCPIVNVEHVSETLRLFEYLNTISTQGNTARMFHIAQSKLKLHTAAHILQCKQFLSEEYLSILETRATVVNPFNIDPTQNCQGGFTALAELASYSECSAALDHAVHCCFTHRGRRTWPALRGAPPGSCQMTRQSGGRPLSLSRTTGPQGFSAGGAGGWWGTEGATEVRDI